MWGLCTPKCRCQASPDGVEIVEPDMSRRREEDVVEAAPEARSGGSPCGSKHPPSPTAGDRRGDALQGAAEEEGSKAVNQAWEEEAWWPADAQKPAVIAEADAWWPADAEKPQCIIDVGEDSPTIEQGALVPPPARVASDAEGAALAKLRQALSLQELEAANTALVPGESLDSNLLRFLRAKDLKIAEAAKLLRADLSWRKTAEPAMLADMRQQEVAECELSLLQKYMPTWHQGFDRSGRPLMFAQYGKFRFPPILAQTSVDKLLRLHMHNSEKAARLCGLQSAKLGRDITNVVTVVDAEGWDPHNLWVKASYVWAQGMASIDQEHYPERLGQMLIINAPQVVYHFWKVVQYVLPEQTRARVKLYSGREKWLPVLLELVAPEELPPEYGGSGVNRNLSPS